MSRATPLVLGVCVLFVAVAARYDVRRDLTYDGRNTLTELTERVLRGLDRDVAVVAFLGREHPGRDELDAVLERYARTSARFAYRITDREREPLLAESFGVLTDGTIALTVGDRRELVRTLDEAGLTNALLRLSRTEGRRARFLTGHRERSVRDTSSGGLSRLAGDLAATGIATGEIQLQTGDEPSDTGSLVVVAGPRTDLFPAEIDWLDRHVAGGGRLLVLADPADLPRLATFLRGLGADLGDDIVVDPQTRLYGADATVPVVTRYARHPVTDPLAGGALIPTFFPVSRSVTLSEGALRVDVLASTSEHAWAERDRESLVAGGSPAPDESELRGPVPIAVAGVRPETDLPALIVVGDSDFATNGNLDLSGNRDFAVNGIEWLLHDEERIALRTARSDARPLVLDANGFRRAVWLPAFGLPMLTAAIGLAVRRRARR
jgi:ABC-type uncharacterized transport system involved in gliding motility auxiliary subunit